MSLHCIPAHILIRRCSRVGAGGQVWADSRLRGSCSSHPSCDEEHVLMLYVKSTSLIPRCLPKPHSTTTVSVLSKHPSSINRGASQLGMDGTVDLHRTCEGRRDIRPPTPVHISISVRPCNWRPMWDSKLSEAHPHSPHVGSSLGAIKCEPARFYYNLSFFSSLRCRCALLIHLPRRHWLLLKIQRLNVSSAYACSST